ncbi:MAG TPA: hypothetical protein VF147_01630 [Vicinamibacterales bacterium]
MSEQHEPPRPHGDPLTDAPDANREDNRGQRDSDAPPDTANERGSEESDREGGRGSDANGLTADDEADGAKRKQQYRDGATLVSRMD